MVDKISSFFHKVLKLPGAFYFFSGGFVLFWMIFFDSNDFISQYQRSRTLRDLEGEEAFYLENINMVKADKDMMTKDASTQERYAREEYRMKKPTEELYIIQYKD